MTVEKRLGPVPDYIKNCFDNTRILTSLEVYEQMKETEPPRTFTALLQDYLDHPEKLQRVLDNMVYKCDSPMVVTSLDVYEQMKELSLVEGEDTLEPVTEDTGGGT